MPTTRSSRASTSMDMEPIVPGTKRRRLRGACDICKQRKVRCDRGHIPGNRCSNCISFNSECNTSTTATTSAALKESKPLQDITHFAKSPQCHVDALITQGASYIADADVRRVLIDVAYYARGLESELASHKHSSFPSLVSTTPPDNREQDEPQDELDMSSLTERFDRFRLDSELTRYFGKSSHLELIDTAIEVKENFIAAIALPEERVRPTKRPLFWHTPWEYEHLAREEVLPPLTFPEPDLLQHLVFLFFRRVNILLCLLHQPTFERSLTAGLHLVDRDFGCTVLGVCALGAKYTDDPRVLLEGTNTQLSAGWKYFCQLQPLQRSLVKPITLYGAHTLCLYVCYLQGSSMPDGIWAVGGAAMRYLQEIGIHRRQRHADKRVGEAWKRVFWLLVCADVLGSSATTRPLTISTSDIDLDYPVECDDEYWESADPTTAFKQPPGKPSVVSYTIAYLKLIEILRMAQRTIYLVKPSDRPPDWPRTAMAALDSALNEWLDMVPDHLRWDPHIEDPIFATQSAILYARYYGVRIHIHRMFLAPPVNNNKMDLSLSNYPSLAICASSARACNHVMNVVVRRGLLCYPLALNCVFDSCIVLLLHVWRSRQGALSADRQKCLQDVDMGLRFFRAYETRWQIAGRAHDSITELMGTANIDWPLTENPLKRGADTHSGAYLASDHAEQQTHQVYSAPLGDPIVEPGMSAFHEADSLSALPISTEDLGRLPVYEPFNWAADPFADLTPLSTGAALGYDASWDNWADYLTSVDGLMSALDNPSM
ncbi:fungal-specific transcription factor domain-containing protein [Mycena maculata]|uniref:Fungal-specific transcription factor domain-containing protein n=1 Tax=Mycena maculata TaxID=230809 RepID=A0AAD7IZL8_9AGAR|nr:fungal-specific transcription factor domain-containing protein [Mycena maculata]